MQARTQWTYSHVWSQLATTSECFFQIGDQQSEKKRWNRDWRAICNAMHASDTRCGVICHRGVCDSSGGARPLWRIPSARTEMFFADVQFSSHAAYPDSCIHWVHHHPKFTCLTLPVSNSSPSRRCCTQLSTFPQLRNNQWLEYQLQSHLPFGLPPPDRPPPSTSSISIICGLLVHLHCHLIMASKFTRSRPPTICPNLLNHTLHVHRIMASMFISNLARLLCPSVSLHYRISAYKCISILARLESTSISLGYFIWAS